MVYTQKKEQSLLGFCFCFVCVVLNEKLIAEDGAGRTVLTKNKCFVFSLIWKNIFYATKCVYESVCVVQIYNSHFGRVHRSVN